MSLKYLVSTLAILLAALTMQTHSTDPNNPRKKSLTFFYVSDTLNRLCVAMEQKIQLRIFN